MLVWGWYVTSWLVGMHRRAASSPFHPFCTDMGYKRRVEKGRNKGVGKVL